MPLPPDRLRGSLVALLLALIALALAANPAHAVETWCADDPVVSVGGRLLDSQVQMPVDKLVVMRSASLTVIVPKNVSGAVIVDDVSAFPMRTTVSSTGPMWSGTGDLPIVIEVAVSSAMDYPIRVVATPLHTSAATAYGTANRTVRMQMALGQ
jgi:hypothetical protein